MDVFFVSEGFETCSLMFFLGFLRCSCFCYFLLVGASSFQAGEDPAHPGHLKTWDTDSNKNMGAFGVLKRKT